MSEARVEQQAFGWSDGDADASLPTVRELCAAPAATAQEAPPSTPPAPRTRARRGLRASAPGAGIASPSDAAPPAGQWSDLPPDDELWDVRAAARFLKRSVSWVYHRVEDGTLPVKRLAGWGVRFIPGELRAWVQDGGGSRR